MHFILIEYAKSRILMALKYPRSPLWNIFPRWMVEGVLNGGEVKNGSDPVSGALSYSQKFSLVCSSL